MYYCSSNNTVFRMNIYQDVSLKLKDFIDRKLKEIDSKAQDSSEEGDDSLDRITKREFEEFLRKSEFTSLQIVRKHFLREPNEAIVKMKVFTSSSKLQYLLIFSTHSMYHAKLLKEPEPLDSLDSGPISLMPEELFYCDFNRIESHPSLKRHAQDPCKQTPNAGIFRRHYTCSDVKIVNTRVFVKFSKRAGMRESSDQRKWPEHCVVRFTLDDHSRRVRYADQLRTGNEDQLRVLDFDSKLFSPIFEKETEDFWLDPSQPDRLYFHLDRKVYMTKFKHFSEQSLQNARLFLCKVVYSSKFEIRFWQFSSKDKLAVCSDKSYRIILIETENWAKIRDFRVSFGEIQQMTLSFRQDLLYV